MTEKVPPTPISKPNVYFIDDSGAMREAVTAAFRSENFNVITCSDVASAVSQFQKNIPQAVISDVILPDRNGYQLCEYIKQHPKLGGTPVLLMSEVVNEQVSERARQGKADELIRKPFHPQDLVACVKKLLNHSDSATTPSKGSGESNPFGSPIQGDFTSTFPSQPPPSPFGAQRAPQATKASLPIPAVNAPELEKLQIEVQRLDALVKKLQNELSSEREYSAALESQLETLSTAK